MRPTAPPVTIPAQTRSPRLPLGTLFLGVLGLGLVAGCDDPSCLFSGTCQTDPGGGGGPTGPVGGLGTVSATFPREGRVMTPNTPVLEASFPGRSADGADVVDAQPQMPMFVQFSESLAPSTVTSDAFELVDQFTLQPLPIFTPALVGDGRVVVITAVAPLPDGRSFSLRFSESQRIADLNGQLFQVAAGQELIGEFLVDTAADQGPRLRYAYPNDGETLVTGDSEIVLGFDRPMDASTFDEQSFVVTVDGVAPANDPAPVPLMNEDVPGGLAQTQVWRWIPNDADDRLVSYGTGANVEVRLSPTSAPILSQAGDTLPLSATQFFTVAFTAPTLVAKPVGSIPSDAFGRREVFEPTATVLEIELAQPAPSGVTAEIYLTGQSPTNSTALRSIVRNVPIPEMATGATFTTAQLNFFDNQGNLQFADGPLSIAVQLRRNNVRSGARIFDGDRDTRDLDTAVIDTTPPTLLGLGADPSSAVVDRFVSDLSDFALVGRADEEVAFAFVSIDGGAADNGGSIADPPATAFRSFDPDEGEGLFVAAPIALGAVDPNGPARTFELHLFDRAGNGTAAAVSGSFEQRGVVGPGGAPAGQPVGVRVFDHGSLVPLANVLVMSYAELGGAVTFVGSGMTDSSGRASVPGAPVGATVVVVDSPDYDLFSFHGVPRDALDVLLEKSTSGPGDASVSGAVSSNLLTGNFTMSSNVVADTRFVLGARLAAVPSLAVDPQTVRYRGPFGPYRIRDGRLGAMTYLATEQALPLVAFNPLAYLRGFSLAAPLAPVPAGEEQSGVSLDAGDQLALAPMEEQSVALQPHGLTDAGLGGLGTLEGDPSVTVEATATGLAGPLVLGRGIAYSVGTGQWSVLAAVAGVGAPGGALEERAAIDPDLHLRVALRDELGNEAVARPRLSGSNNLLEPIDVPLVLSPAPGGIASGSSFNVVVADTVDDASGLDAVTRVRLEDLAGRGWTAYTLDTDDAAGDLLVSFPDVSANGGVGLVAGTINVSTAVFAGAFDRGEFLYTELERRSLAEARAARTTFTLP